MVGHNFRQTEKIHIRDQTRELARTVFRKGPWMTASVRPLNVSEDGSAAHDEYDHVRHHVKLTYYPTAFKEGGRHAVRRDREPDLDPRLSGRIHCDARKPP